MSTPGHAAALMMPTRDFDSFPRPTKDSGTYTPQKTISVKEKQLERDKNGKKSVAMKHSDHTKASPRAGKATEQ